MYPIFSANSADALILAIAYLVWVIPELIWSLRRRPDREAVVNDRWSSRVLLACIWLGISAAWACAYALPQFAIRWERPALFDLGILLMLSGMALRWYSISVLGRFFTVQVAIQPHHDIVERGPYRVLRHPSYSGALLTILGFGLALGNIPALLAALMPTALGYAYRIAVEERALLEALGDAYGRYMNHTKRIIPFVF